MTTLLTVILGFTHYLIKKDPLIPVICLALLCAGFMDGFHTLATTKLIEAFASNKDLIPFSWAICRFFNPIISLAGVSIFLLKKDTYFGKKPIFIFSIGAILILAAYIITHVIATSAVLPQTQFPGDIITRPWDIYPLLAFVGTAITYILLFRHRPTPFVHALILSTVPNLAVQLHMAFGSSHLFDSHFNIAHSLKVIAYLIPFIGLAYEYVRTYRKEKSSELTAINSSKLASLGEMAGGIAHDINNPLAIIDGHANKLKLLVKKGNLKGEDINSTAISIQKTTKRIAKIIQGLHRYSRDDSNNELSLAPLAIIISETLVLCQERFQNHGIELLCTIDLSTDQMIFCREVEVSQVLLNLMNNSFDAIADLNDKWIRIDSQKIGKFIEITVTDSGHGLSEEVASNIFNPFHTTKGLQKGAGLGLSICQNIALAHNGYLKLNKKSPNTQFILGLNHKKD